MNIYEISKLQYIRERQLEKYIQNFIIQARRHNCSEAEAAAKRILNHMYKLKKSKTT